MSISGSGTIIGAPDIGTSNALIYCVEDISKYYRFDSTILNYANNQGGFIDASYYSASVITPPTYSTTIFKVGTASIYFPGPATGLAITTYTTTNAGYTVSFWCYSAAASNVGNNTFFNITGSTQGMFIFNNTNAVSVAFTPGGNWGTGFTIPDNIWTHIAFVYYANSTTILYVNGAYNNQTTGYTYQIFTSVLGSSAIGARVSPAIGANCYVGYLDDFRLYNNALSSVDINTIYNFPVINNTSIINFLIPGKQPWGIYDAVLWNSSANTLREARGNGRDVVLNAGAVTKGTATAGTNGAAASIPYISGVTTTKLLWPTGSLPTNFTICSITRYTTAGTNNQRILTSNSGNVIHGHHNTGRGTAYYNGTWKTNQVNTGTLNNWLVMCGNNGSSVANGILIDSVASGIASGGTGGGQLAINMYPGAVEPSDWTFTYTVIYDTVLTDDEMLTVSNKLLSYLANGKM